MPITKEEEKSQSRHSIVSDIKVLARYPGFLAPGWSVSKLLTIKFHRLDIHDIFIIPAKLLQYQRMAAKGT